MSVSRCSPPLPAITSVHVRTSMFESRLDLLHEVVGHRCFERRAADQDGHRLGVAGEIHRGLAGGVGPADDEDVLPATSGASLIVDP